MCANILTGATAAQIIPEILPTSQDLTVYQRSPNWVIPRLDGPISALRQFVYRYLPPVRWRIRASQMDFRESFHSAVFDSTSEFADQIREWCAASLRAQIPGQEDLWTKLTPVYSPGCKRVIISDDYYPALADPKTTLETQEIIKITESGVQVRSENGSVQTHEHDTLVLATGFRTVEFLSPIKITGANRRKLNDIWATGAEALYGITVPDLPNFGMFYGPNTNLGHNSIVLMIEAQSRYLNGLVGAVLDARNRGERIGIMPKKEKTRVYNEEIQEKLNKSSFADPNCGSWYKNKEGKITNNWSGTVVEYQELLEKVDWEDFEVVGTGQGGSASKVVFGEGKKETRVGRVVEGTRVSNTGLVVGGLGVVAAGVAWMYRGSLTKRLRR